MDAGLSFSERQERPFVHGLNEGEHDDDRHYQGCGPHELARSLWQPSISPPADEGQCLHHMGGEEMGDAKIAARRGPTRERQSVRIAMLAADPVTRSAKQARRHHGRRDEGADGSDTAHDNKVYQGKEEVRSYWADVSGPFRPEHHWIGFTPAMRINSHVTEDTGTLDFECLWMKVDDNTIGAHAFSSMKLARVNGHWLVKVIKVGKVDKL